jgi:WhiB family redox-sensing transcriptional regulator
MFATELFQTETLDPALDWARAACRTESGALTGLFFSEQLDDIARAKAICTGCELRVPCLDGAVARREPWGVWGGQLFANGKILAQKRKRGRPPKIRPVEVVIGAEPEAQSA